MAAGGRLPDLPAQLRRLRTATASATSPASRARSAVPARARGRRRVAEPVLPLRPGRRRLRRRRLPRRRPADRHARRSSTRSRDALHGAGIRLIVDIVPNHTSNRHAWFQEALVAAGSGRAGARPVHLPARPRSRTASSRRPTGRSHLRRPAPGSPSRDGEWYLHLFAPEQPDLNWANAEVRAGLPDDTAVLGRPRRRRVPHRRRPRAGQGPHRAAREPGRPRRGRLPRTGRTRCRTATRSTTSTASGATAVQRVRPAAHGRRRGVGPRAPRGSRYARPEGLGQAFNFDLLEADWDATTFAASHRHEPSR